MWVNLARYLIFSLIAYLLTPKPKVNEPVAATQASGVPQATAGDEIPQVFGTCWITTPQVGWNGDFRSAPIKQKGSKK